MGGLQFSGHKVALSFDPVKGCYQECVWGFVWVFFLGCCHSTVICDTQG